MNTFRNFVNEMIEKKKMLTILAVLLVPFVYGLIIISANWGPYDNLNNLPVAVVNSDQGATSEGKAVHVGDDLVQELKKNPTLKWDFVSKSTAESGIKNNKYYMVIEIPSDFSKNVTTVLDSNPKMPELNYIQNEGLHFMAASVTSKAAETLKNTLNEKITATYTASLFNKLKDISSGFDAGANGAGQINDGSNQLKDGTNQILTSLNEKSPSINELASGAKALHAGTSEFYSGLLNKQSSIKELAEGSNKLAGGTSLLYSTVKNGTSKINDLKNGTASLKNGATQLKSGSDAILTGLNAVNSGLQTSITGMETQLVPGMTSVATNSAKVDDSVQKIAAGNAQLAAALAQYAKSPALASDPTFQAIAASAAQLAAGSGQLAQGTPALKAGTAALQQGVQGLLAGSMQLHTGVESLTDGQSKLNTGLGSLVAGSTLLDEGGSGLQSSWSTLTSSIGQINDGMKKVNEGNTSVNVGWSTLTSGAKKINDGMSKVDGGTASVQSGWSTLINGVSQVDGGLAKVQAGSKELSDKLKDGAKETGAVNGADRNIAMYAAPVKLQGEVINIVPEYRNANAPFVLSLALFVGVLMLLLTVSVRKPSDVNVSSRKWHMERFGIISALAAIQAVLLSVLSLMFLNLEATASINLVIFSVIASLTFLSITYFLVAIAGNIGRFLAFAILVLQLSITGGALPVEMIPQFHRTLSAFLPMHYSVAGFREIISVGKFSYFNTNASVLIVSFIVFTVLAVGISSVMKNSSREEESLAA